MNPNGQFDPKKRVDNNLRVMQPGEREIFTVKRHPIGLIAIYVTIAVVVALMAVLAFGILPSADSGGNTATVSAVIFVFLTALALIYALIATTVYEGNSWVVTSDSLTQVSQTSLFNRQSSQLSLANLEDVTAEQNGIFAHIFNYGILKAETAGEHSKFRFVYCPNPNLYAQQILHAREEFEQGGGHLGTAQPPVQAPATAQPVTNPEPPQQTGGPGFNSNI